MGAGYNIYYSISILMDLGRTLYSTVKVLWNGQISRLELEVVLNETR